MRLLHDDLHAPAAARRGAWYRLFHWLRPIQPARPAAKVDPAARPGAAGGLATDPAGRSAGTADRAIDPAVRTPRGRAPAVGGARPSAAGQLRSAADQDQDRGHDQDHGHDHDHGHGTVKVRPRPVQATHTVEMTQLVELNRSLVDRPVRPPITAAELDLPTAAVPADAVLVGVHWEGPTKYPYIHARFHHGADIRDAAGLPTDGLHTVDLHTQALRVISRRLGLAHVWGT